MKKLLFLLALMPLVSFAQKVSPGTAYPYVITRVIDGDTVAFQAPFLPQPLKPELSVRIFGVDTPEKAPRAKCDAENQKAQAATHFTMQAILQAKTRYVVIMDWDKYGGRVLGDVILDGKSLRTLLLTNGMAREYHGDAKKSWCN